MSRLVEAKPKPTQRRVTDPTAADMSSGGDPWQKVKDYGERVAKYIPAEVIAFYTAATQLILMASANEEKPLRLWLFGIFGLIAWIGTPLLLGRYSNDPRTRIPNQVVGFLAFAVWAYAYPAGWFAEMGLYKPLIGGLLLLLFTFGIAFYTPTRG